MNADEFLAWTRGRVAAELHDGEVAVLPHQPDAHERAKRQVHAALRNAILRAGSPCRAYDESMGLRVNARNLFRPDVIVALAPAPPEAMEITNPVIVVEVISPGTAAIDRGPKFVGYFSVSCVAHYLVIDPRRRLAVHHQRGRGENIDSRVIGEAGARFDPPGLVIATREIF